MVDGGSTDGSVELIRQHEAAITQWISEPDEGYADAIAKGFARASGDVLCWINAGDLLLERNTCEGARDFSQQAMPI